MMKGRMRKHKTKATALSVDAGQSLLSDDIGTTKEGYSSSISVQSHDGMALQHQNVKYDRQSSLPTDLLLSSLNQGASCKVTMTSTNTPNLNNNGTGCGKRKQYKRLMNTKTRGSSGTSSSAGSSGAQRDQPATTTTAAEQWVKRGSAGSWESVPGGHDSSATCGCSSSSSSLSTGASGEMFPAEYLLRGGELSGSDLRPKRVSAHRVSYRKAIQKAGYNMNEILSPHPTGNNSPATMRRSHVATEVEWTDTAQPDDHIWAPTSASGDLCYVGEQMCSKSGSRKKCSACHIVVHDACFPQLFKIGFRCKATFREATGNRSSREVLIVRHHWVHRRKQEGKCRQCGKSFEKRFGFRDSKIIAISCSWCKEAYHNKVSCFSMHNLSEPCQLGMFAGAILPPTWLVKQSGFRQKSGRNRSRKKRFSGGSRRRSSNNNSRHRMFVIRPQSNQVAYVRPVLVFINPKSGGNQGLKLMQAFQLHLNPRQVFDLSKGGPLEGLELFRRVPNVRILACGGDGTVGWILSVMDQMGLGKPPPVAILPLGTGNDLSRTLNFGPGYTDETVQKILQGVEDSKVVKLDRWKLRVERNDQVTVTSQHHDNDDEQAHGGLDDGHGVDKPPLDVVNNYFSIGSDAQVTLDFHQSREARPDKFNSRFGNKLFYARAGMLEYLSRQSKDLGKHIQVVCDGKNITQKIRDLKPVCLLFLNIPRYSSGTSPWGNPTGGEFKAQRHDDRLVEVLAFSINQLGMLFVGGHGERLCQCRSAKIITDKTFPVQIDGEPCRLNPCNITLEFFKQSTMLQKSKRRVSYRPDMHHHEQIKIRIGLLNSSDYDMCNGRKAQLVRTASPLLVTVATNHSTLDTIRSSLEALYPIERARDTISDRWIFLDASGPDLYQVDRCEERQLFLHEIVSSDREVFLLDLKPSMATVATSARLSSEEGSALVPGSATNVFFPRSKLIDRNQRETYRNRFRSDSVFATSLDESSTNSSELDMSGVIPPLSKVISLDELPHVPLSTDHHVTSASAHSPPLVEMTSDRDDQVLVVTTEGEVATTTNSSDDCSCRTPEQQPSQNVEQDATQGVTSSEHASVVEPASADDDPASNASPASRVEESTSSSGNHSMAPQDASDAAKLSCPKHAMAPNRLLSDHSPYRRATANNSNNNNAMAVTSSCRADQIFLDACKRGDVSKASQSLLRGADVQARDVDGSTALHVAAVFGYAEIVDLLLSAAPGATAFVDATDDRHQQTALHKAAWFGRDELCRRLVEAGANIALADHEGNNAIDCAKAADAHTLVDYLTQSLRTRYRAAMKSANETNL